MLQTKKGAFDKKPGSDRQRDCSDYAEHWPDHSAGPMIPSHSDGEEREWVPEIQRVGDPPELG